MRVDVVGGVQQLAENWVALDERVRDLRRKADDASREWSVVLQEQTEVAKRLSERVGPNVSVKAFRVGEKVVIVEYERGIHCIEFEGASSIWE